MKNRYPFIFVHGMLGWGERELFYKPAPYWGMVCGNLMKQLRSAGYEAYAPKVGPMNSAWDRACELYALLTGTRVDYGKAHSEQKHHERFGRTYEQPLFPGWGSEKKVHLLGHSFGGATIRLLTELLTNGDPEERDSTSASELSPLFAGGHGNLLHVVSTHTGVLNGTTMASFGKPFLPLLSSVMLGAMELLENTPFMKVLDMGQQQFGLGAYPEETPYGIGVNPPKQTLEGIKAYSKDGLDNIYQEMSIDFRQENNQNIGVNPHVYYFANRTCASKPGPNGHQISTEGIFF